MFKKKTLSYFCKTLHFLQNKSEFIGFCFKVFSLYCEYSRVKTTSGIARWHCIPADRRILTGNWKSNILYSVVTHSWTGPVFRYYASLVAHFKTEYQLAWFQFNVTWIRLRLISTRTSQSFVVLLCKALANVCRKKFLWIF